jgi:hypothetical protein
MDDLTFRLGDTGVVLNDDSTTFVDVLKVTGLDSAPFRTTERDHEGDDGGFIDAEFEKARTIVIDGVVYSDVTTLESYLDTIKENYAPSPTLIKFYVQAPGVVERILFVKPLGLLYDWTIQRRYGCVPIQIKMYAEDPRIYSSELLSVPVTLGGVVTTGFGFNFGFDFGFGATSVGGGNNAHNSGNRSTPAIFTIPGPVTNPSIYNDTSGEVMQFSNIVIASGESLVVDTNYRTVRLDSGVNRRYALTRPTWIRLAKGDNTIRFLAESGGTTMTVQYRHAWR